MPTIVNIDFKEVEEILKDRGLEKGGSVQKYFTNELWRASDKYTPFAGGILKGSAGLALDGEHLEYRTPYARYLYYGKLMVSPTTGTSFAKKGEQKVLTNIDLNYQEAPIRGPKWVERAWLDNKGTIVKSVQKFVDKGGK